MQMEIEENVVIEEAPEVETPRVIDRSGEPVIEFENVVKNYYLYKSGRERFKAMFTGNRGVRQRSAAFRSRSTRANLSASSAGTAQENLLF